MMNLFAVLELEREPLRWIDLTGLLSAWLRDAGAVALIGLIVLVLATQGTSVIVGRQQRYGMIVFGAMSLFFYSCGLALAMTLEWPSVVTNPQTNQQQLYVPPRTQFHDFRDFLSAAGGLAAMIGVGVPFLTDLTKLSPRRIAAITRLGILEAVRQRVLWIFLLILLVFLFPAKWFVRIKPEDEVRAIVGVIDFFLSAPMILAGSFLAAFSLSNDMKYQTIHTVVTKPVERFEIVLGRFLGYAILSGAILAVLSLFAVFMMWASNVSPEAANESYKARVPIYGELDFRRVDANEQNIRDPNFTGESVGREWEYRKYLEGGVRTSRRAAWTFDDLPAALGDLPAVPVEFALDIFRTTKGEENRGVKVSFVFRTAAAQNNRSVAEYREAVRSIGNPNAQYDDPRYAADWAKIDALAERTGVYEFRGKEIFDYRTFTLQVPPGLFRNALAARVPAGGSAPRLEILLKCDSPTQYVGVAKRDLYILAGDGSFALNFLKSTFGLWLRLCIVIGIAVTCSTCLPGVVSWMAAVFLFGTGIFREFIEQLAFGLSVGGGPAESLVRLLGNKNLTTPLDPTPATQLAQASDMINRWILQLFLNFTPAVDRLDWTNYVSEGFDISGADLTLNTLMVVGYLLPWGVLAYYLIKSREIAR